MTEPHIYKFTFEDGSEALSHDGVQGMKWGEHKFGNLADRVQMAQNAKGIDKALAILGGGGGVPLDGEEQENADPAKDVSETVSDVKAGVETMVNSTNDAINQLKDKLFGSKKNMTDAKVQELAESVIRGDYGNGEERYQKLSDAGYSYSRVQTKVNDIVYGTNDYAEGRNTSGREDRV